MQCGAASLEHEETLSDASYAFRRAITQSLEWRQKDSTFHTGRISGFRFHSLYDGMAS